MLSRPIRRAWITCACFGKSCWIFSVACQNLLFHDMISRRALRSHVLKISLIYLLHWNWCFIEYIAIKVITLRCVSVYSFGCFYRTELLSRINSRWSFSISQSLLLSFFIVRNLFFVAQTFVVNFTQLGVSA